jgi:hypothetical protein
LALKYPLEGWLVMGQCKNCGQEARYDLCYKCYSEQKNAQPLQTEEAKPLASSGLSDNELEYRHNMIKARIAETLIEELFLSMEWGVFRYGMENTIPGVMTLLKGVRSDVAENIKRMPDFVIQDKQRNVYFIEVKFRANEKYALRDLPRDYPYENAFIVVVSKKHIKCITVPELREGKEISPSTRNYLGSRKEFDLDKETIIQFCDFAVKFFDNV